MEFDFNDLDKSLAKLNAEFNTLQSGISTLDAEDPFAEFLNDPAVQSHAPPTAHATPQQQQQRYAAAANSAKHVPPSSKSKDPFNAALDSLDPYYNPLDKTLNEIDHLIETPSPAQNNMKGMKGNPTPAAAATAGAQGNNKRPVMRKTDSLAKIVAPKLERQNDGGPSYFTIPELIDVNSEFSVPDLQKTVKKLQEDLVNMAQQANSELHQYFDQVKIFDEDNARAFKTIQDLKTDLLAQSEDWENSDKLWKEKVEKVEEDNNRLKQQVQSGNKNSAELERYKSGLLLLKQKLQTIQIDSAKKDEEINNLRRKYNYLLEEKKALEETAADLVNAGLSNPVKEDYEKKLKDKEEEIGVLQREVNALKSDRNIWQSRVEQMTQEQLANGNDDMPELKLQILKLEAENESSNLKIKRLLAAIKADRNQNEEKLKALQKERDIHEERAEELESKIVQIMERVRIEREDTTLKQGLDEAKEALKEAENKILIANEATTNAERSLQQKGQELQKYLLFGKKKAREAQVAVDDLKAMEEKSNKLVEVIKTLKDENQRLKAGLDSTQSSANLSEELETANQRATKLEQAVRKLRQMVSETQEEGKDKEKAYEERLRTAESLLSAAEERARNAASLAELTTTSSLTTFIPPPPPPPMPKIKLNYDLKVNRTGQTSFIEGEPARPKPKNVFVDSIVDAIKKGVTLRKTGLREYDGSEEGDRTVIAPAPEDDDLNVEDAFAAMAREIAMNKQKRERDKTQQQGEVAKKRVENWITS
jgi:chromosome segregation ATPase